MKRGPRLAKNQYLSYVTEALPSDQERRMLGYLNEAWGHKPLPLGQPNTAPEGLKDAVHSLMRGQEVKLLVTIRRDGSKHCKVTK